MQLIELTTHERTQTGNGPARVLRREGRIPAVLYGPGKEPVLLSVDTGELQKALKSSTGSQPLFNLTLEGSNAGTRSAMIKELQTHPVSRSLIHADFYEIAMDRKIRVSVPVTTTGKSIGVEMGGMLQIIRRELEVMCLPLSVPEVIEIDITPLDVGDSLHVEDIPLEEGIDIPTDVNFTVLTILSPKVEVQDEEEELDEEAEGVEAAESADEASGEA